MLKELKQTLVTMAVENVLVRPTLLVTSVTNVPLNIMDSQNVKVCQCFISSLHCCILVICFFQIACAMLTVQWTILVMKMANVLAMLMWPVRSAINVLQELLNFQVVTSVLQTIMISPTVKGHAVMCFIM